jgi:hypothetical protein
MKRWMMLLLAFVLVFSFVGIGTAAAGPGATVDKEEPGIINRVTPSGICLRSHHQADWPDPGFGPGGGDPVGNFTDFGEVGGGNLEFGLVTPSRIFNGQSHHPCP